MMQKTPNVTNGNTSATAPLFNLSQAHFCRGRQDNEDVTPEEAMRIIAECTMAIADLASLLDSVDVPRLIENGYDFAIQRYANIIEMLSLNAHAMADELDDYFRRQTTADKLEKIIVPPDASPKRKKLAARVNQKIDLLNSRLLDETKELIALYHHQQEQASVATRE